MSEKLTSIRGRPQQWTHESAIQELKLVAKRLGHAPSVKELRADSRCHISPGQIYRLFGGLPKACEAAGLTYQRPDTSRYRDDEMLNRLRSLSTELGKTPEPSDYRKNHGGNGYNYYARRWGSFHNAVEAADLEVERNFTTPQEAKKALQECAEQLGAVPTQQQYRTWAAQSADRPKARLMRVLYGSWTRALEAACLQPNRTLNGHQPASNRRREGVLKACYKDLGHTPTAAQYRTWAAAHPQMPTLAELLGSGHRWNEILAVAGLTPHMRRDWTKSEVQPWLKTWRRQHPLVKKPQRSQWDAWAQMQMPLAPKSATVARILGQGSWLKALRSAGWT